MAGSDHLKPGGKGGITATLAAGTRPGRVVEKIEVVSNDPKRPKVTLTLQAIVTETALPAVLDGILR
jgi:hypothetical protein